MPKRRPPGAGPALRTSNLFAILLVLPWISTAAQQQHPPERHHSRSPLVQARLNTDVPPKHGKHSHQLDDPEYEYQHSFAPNYAQNVRAVATTVSSAPAVSAVRAPPAGNAATSNNLERPRARSLQDWLVEDFVLLATVDGHIHARDRYTGDPIWELSSPKPMLEVIYNKNTSDGLNGWQDAPFLWIVEPKEDGALYVLTPGAYPKLQPLGMTIKQMTDEMNPYTSDDPPVVYTAKKESSMYVVDARTGNVTKIFSPSGSMSIDAEKCKTHGPDYFDSKESDCRGILNLGQTDYTISIHNKDTLEHVCTIKYSEWTPNNRDRDLQSQYAAPMDQHYIYSRYNGNYLAYDHKRPTWRTRPVYERKLPYPVARVFDVARGREEQDPDASLILLPQPLGPAFLEDKAKNVWLNTTDMGSWYALSESNFPAVTDGAPVAPCYMHNSLRSWDGPHFLPPRGGLVGVHELDYHMEPPQTHLAIAGPTPSNNAGNVISIPPEIPRRPQLDPPPVASIEPPSKANWSPVMWTIVALMGFLLVAYQQLAGHGKKTLFKFRQALRPETPVPAIPVPSQPETVVVEPHTVEQPIEQVIERPAEQPIEQPVGSIVGTEEPVETSPAPVVQEPKEKKVTFDVPDEDEDDLSLSRTTTTQELPTEVAATSTEVEPSPSSEPQSTDGSQELGLAPATPTKKKKTHRGKRGGQKGKNKKPKEGDEMDQIVDAAKHLNETPSLQPDEITPYGADMQDVSNVKKIGKLTIDFDRVLGNGSGGTFVFEGKWNDRDVAIKRMLPQYFGLAEQEVKLLQESDHHANVIRYYDDEKDENFLYIAVELCQASLFDLYRDGRPGDDITETQQRLVNEINSSVPRALHQLAEGVHHLHSLRIIHRDIKPQNILIAYPQRNQKNGPRLVISDFGLCKTLPDNMSTLIGTTGNAGTVGWKAPELILQPRDMGMGSSTGYSRDSSNSTDPVSQGVKRAVDIFSLGCVFFYVLTNGSHPFDDDEGWAQMREYNIKKNKASFEQLRLGDDSEEPVHLISWMLENRPEDRPTAAQVMNHPFFWNAEKRLAFLCDCSDHWEREPRDPPSDHLYALEEYTIDVLDKKRNFLAKLDHGFIASLGKQRKYTGDRLLDLLRALRNKKNHYEDMDEGVKAKVGPLPHGYLRYWTVKFPRLLMSCYDCVVQCGLQGEPRFRPYFEEGNK